MRGDAERDSLRLRFVLDSCWGDAEVEGPLPGAREEGGRRWWCEDVIRNRAFTVMGENKTAKESPGEKTLKRHAAAVDTRNAIMIRLHRERAAVPTL